MKTNDHNTTAPLDPLKHLEWLEEYIPVPEAAKLRNQHPSTFKRHNSHLITNLGTRLPRVKRRDALGLFL